MKSRRLYEQSSFFADSVLVARLGVRTTIVALLATLAGTALGCVATRRGLHPLRPLELAVVEPLRTHVERLAIRPRDLTHFPALERAADYIAGQLVLSGSTVNRHEFRVGDRTVANLEVERRGGRRPERNVVIGAHYDSAGASPGASDNASDVAVLIEPARLHAAAEAPGLTLRFVAFVNEEPPHFMTQTMGSLVYAREAAARQERIEAIWRPLVLQ